MKLESINELCMALAKAQSKFGPILKDTDGYNYAYATLDQLIEKTKGPLTENELAHVAMIEERENGKYLVCSLMHSSGQHVSSEMRLIVDTGKKMSPMQQLGSAITYGRRYLLQGLLGVAAEEDTDENDKNDKENGTTQSNKKVQSKKTTQNLDGQQVASNKSVEKPRDTAGQKKPESVDLLSSIKIGIGHLTDNYTNPIELDKLRGEYKFDKIEDLGKKSTAELVAIRNNLRRKYASK